MARTFALTVSMIALVIFSLPAIAAGAKMRPLSSEAPPRTIDNHGRFDRQAPRSTAATNAHVYHGGPKAND
jgi:hypothetical protein